MGDVDAYDDASVGTTESEGEDDGKAVGGQQKRGGGGGGGGGGKNKGKALEGGKKASTSGHGSDSAEDYTDDEDEGEDGYKPGGYHRVKVGEVYNQR